jgi:signal transduction histidine kinase
MGVPGERKGERSAEDEVLESVVKANMPQQKTEQFIAELLAAISHEFRTPLAAIKGYSSMLLRQDDQLSAEERQEGLRVIQDASERLKTLTDRLLEITSLETGTFRFDRRIIQPLPVIYEAVVSAQEQLPELLRARLTFQIHLRDERGNPTQEIPPLSGDRRALRIMLDHLLENAVRFSPEGGQIDVVIWPVVPNRTSQAQDAVQVPLLEICVCDYGIGIPDQHLDRIFERFYRVDTRLTREVNGLGVGLAICAQLAALHQGKIWAESCPAGGSVFHLRLPIAQAG